MLNRLRRAVARIAPSTTVPFAATHPTCTPVTSPAGRPTAAPVAGPAAGVASVALGAAARAVVEALEDRQLLSVPNGPFGAAAALSGSNVNVSWYDNAGDETGFKVERRAAGGDYQFIGTAGNNATSFVDSSAPGGTQYTYRIRAYNATGDSSTSETNSILTPAATTQTATPAVVNGTGNSWSLPNGPFGLGATATSGGVQLVWYSNSNNETGFKIDRSNGGGGWSTVATVGAGITRYTDAAVSSGTAYTYRVYACNNAGNSAAAGPVTVTATSTGSGSTSSSGSTTTSNSGSGSSTSTNPNAGTTPLSSFKPSGGWGSLPNTPFSLDTKATASLTILLVWHSNSNNEGGFVIQRKAAGGTYGVLTTVGPGVTTYTDNSAQAGVQYTYRVAAYNAAGLSGFTNELATQVNTATPGSAAGVDIEHYFSIGVFLQAIPTMDTWKARGINTLWEYEPNQAWMETWLGAAESKGFMVIRNARSNPADDLHDPNLLAYFLADEPDIHNVSPALLQQQYNALKAANPSVPVIINVSGANVTNQLDSLPDSLYRQFAQASDWMSSDMYPLSPGYKAPDWIDLLTYKPVYEPQWDRGPANPGNSVEWLRNIVGGKHQIAFIESSLQDPSNPAAQGWRAPTPDEFRGEIWDAIVHGAKGVCYFPFSFPSGDGTPPDIVAEMTKQDALMSSLGTVITNFNDSVPQEISGLPKGVEGMWRQYNGHTYYFLLNMTHTPQYNMNIKLPGVSNGPLKVLNEGRSVNVANGAFTEGFGAYGLHIYVS